MMRTLRPGLIALLIVGLVYAPAFALQPGLPLLNRALSTTKTEAPVAVQITKPHKGGELLVKFRFGVPEWAKQQVKEAWSKESKELKGRKGVEKLRIKDGASLNQTLMDLQQVNQIVEWVEPNYLVSQTARQVPPTPNDPQFANQWALENTGTGGGTIYSDIRAKAGWVNGTGSDRTIVAIIDTGIDLNHVDLKNNLWVNQKENKGKKNQDDDNNGYVDDLNGWNFVNHSPNVSDDQNHGTNMAGVIAAQGNNGVGMTGVLWQASLMTLKALDASGSGYVSDVVEALDYAADNGASVINCSFGTEAFSVALQEAIIRAGQSGALVVTSAGNNGQDLATAPQYPASFNLSNLITVAATTNQDLLTAFSNYGATVQLAAPGIDVLTTQRNGGYVNVTGTSVSAALVSGVAGLLKTQRGWLSGFAIRQAMLDGVRQIGFLQGKVTSSGVVNAGDAITKLLSAGTNGGGNGNGGGNNGGGNNGGGNNGGGNNGGGNNGGGNTGQLDFIRAHHPNPAEPRVYVNSLPDPVYDDPTGGSNFESYYVEEHKPQNRVGRAEGSDPAEWNDPTDGQGGVGQTSINLGSQNINFTAPVLGLDGRAGLGVGLTLSYNSKVWLKEPSASKIIFNSDKSFPGPGWQIGFGVIEGKDNSGSVGSYTSGVTGQQAYTFIASDGSRHELSYNSTSGKYESYDSTYMDFDVSTKKLRLMNGTVITFGDTSTNDFQFLPTQIKDRNGNYITIVNETLSNGNKVINYVIDTLGRYIDFFYENNRLTRIRQCRNANSATPGSWPSDKANAAWHNYLIIDWAEVTLDLNFSGLTIDPGSLTSVFLPAVLTYPNGNNYRCFYTSYAQMYLVEKWVPTVSGQGSARRVAYTRYDLPSKNSTPYPSGAVVNPTVDTSAQSDCPKFANRYEWAENWNLNGSGVPQEATYTYAFNSGHSTVTDPLGRVYRTDQSSSGGITTTTSKVYAPGGYNGGSGTPLKTITTTYVQDSGPSYTANQRIASLTITDGSYTRKTEISYNTTSVSGVALPENVDDYNAAGTSVYRRRHTDYNASSDYTSRHIYGLPSARKIYSGAGTTLLAQTEYAYDETSYFQDSSGESVIQWDSTGGTSATGRGNLTTTTQYAVSSGSASNGRVVGARLTYDSQGVVRTATDAASNVTTFDVTDNFSNKPSGVGVTHGMTTRIVDPASYQNGAKFDWYAGLPVESYHIQGTNPSGTHQLITTYSYDSSDRHLSTSFPDGGWQTFDYWDNWLAVAQYDSIATSVQRYSFTAYDGAGHLRWRGGDHPDGSSGKYSIQKFEYDVVGRQNNVSNVTAINGSYAPIDDDATPGYQWTQLTRDALDRTTTITRPDSDTITYSYTGCGCAGSSTVEITDERGKRRKTVNDHLGRLLEAHDLTSAGATYSKAIYTNNELDQLTRIEHFNNSTAHQDRTFAYDGYGRLTSQTTPEAGTTSYTYTTLDQVDTITLANNRTRTFTYNSRGLLTDIVYDGTDTPKVKYTYDEFGTRTLMEEKNSSNTVIGSTTYSYNSYHQLESETRVFNGLSGTFKVEYQYNLAGALKTLTYTVGSWVKNVNYAYNYAGAVTGVGTNIISGASASDTTNVATSFSYRGFGGVKAMTYGNGQVLSASYNATRQQLTNQTWQKGGTVIVNKDYDYNNGGDNNGRIQKITDHVDGGYTTTYGYDDYNRLTSASNSAYTRSYSYDAWANLTGVTATGTSETGSYSLSYATNGSGAPATNRVSGDTYDNAGNPTSTSGYSLAYDAANRIKNVGSNNPREYDGDGRRVMNNEDNAGNITLFYLWSSLLGQVVCDLRADYVASHLPFRAYVYSPSGALLGQQSYDTAFTWLHTDHLGSGHKVTDATGAVIMRDEYDPHGQWVYAWNSGAGGYYNSRKFTGYERDYAAGSHYAKARQYQQTKARFMQPDPLSLGASDLTHPQSLNLYSYVQNDPVNFTDPTGLFLAVERPDWSALWSLIWGRTMLDLPLIQPVETGDDKTVNGGNLGEVTVTSTIDPIPNVCEAMADIAQAFA